MLWPLDSSITNLSDVFGFSFDLIASDWDSSTEKVLYVGRCALFSLKSS